MGEEGSVSRSAESESKDDRLAAIKCAIKRSFNSDLAWNESACTYQILLLLLLLLLFVPRNDTSFFLTRSKEDQLIPSRSSPLRSSLAGAVLQPLLNP